MSTTLNAIEMTKLIASTAQNMSKESTLKSRHPFQSKSLVPVSKDYTSINKRFYAPKAFLLG